MTQYFYRDPNAPIPSSLHIGAVVAIRHNGRVLLDHRRDGMWGLIGGAQEIGESLEECVRRETLEETSLEIDELRIVGIFSDASRIIQREAIAVQSVTICFDAATINDQFQLSDESREARFFSEPELASVPIVKTHSMIIPYLFSSHLWPVIA